MHDRKRNRIKERARKRAGKDDPFLLIRSPIAEYALDGDAGGSAIEAQILRRNESRDIHLPCGGLNTEGPKTKIPAHSHKRRAIRTGYLVC